MLGHSVHTKRGKVSPPLTPSNDPVDGYYIHLPNLVLGPVTLTDRVWDSRDGSQDVVHRDKGRGSVWDRPRFILLGFLGPPVDRTKFMAPSPTPRSLPRPAEAREGPVMTCLEPLVGL